MMLVNKPRKNAKNDKGKMKTLYDFPYRQEIIFDIMILGLENFKWNFKKSLK